MVNAGVLHHNCMKPEGTVSVRTSVLFPGDLMCSHGFQVTSSWWKDVHLRVLPQRAMSFLHGPV